jgi:nitrite reductase/ring-hydroxylating ferredoxin subunit
VAVHRPVRTRAPFPGARLPGAADLPDGGRRIVRVGDLSLVVVRAGDERYACENRCLHVGIRLSDGFQGGAVLECRWHHWRYDLRTGCVEAEDSPFALFTTYPVLVDGEDLVIRAEPRTRLRRRATDPDQLQQPREDRT